MDAAAAVVLVYGIFTFTGGLLGYLRARSNISLLAGVMSGVILVGSAYAMEAGFEIAYLITLLLSLILGIKFLGSWLKNHRVIPDLVMVLLSFVSIVFVGTRILNLAPIAR